MQDSLLRIHFILRNDNLIENKHRAIFFISFADIYRQRRGFAQPVQGTAALYQLCDLRLPKSEYLRTGSTHVSKVTYPMHFDGLPL